MDLTQLMGLFGNKDELGGLAKKAGVDSGQIEGLLSNGLPEILGALKTNTNSEDGMNSLFSALGKHENVDIKSLLSNPENIDVNDGSKILGHIFGSKQNDVNDRLAKSAGISSSQAGNVMSMLAPLLMGALGNAKKESNLDSSGLKSMLGSLMGAGGVMNAAKGFLDKDGDGDIIDDAAGMLGGLFGKK